MSARGGHSEPQSLAFAVVPANAGGRGGGPRPLSLGGKNTGCRCELAGSFDVPSTSGRRGK